MPTYQEYLDIYSGNTAEDRRMKLNDAARDKRQKLKEQTPEPDPVMDALVETFRAKGITKRAEGQVVADSGLAIGASALDMAGGATAWGLSELSNPWVREQARALAVEVSGATRKTTGQMRDAQSELLKLEKAEVARQNAEDTGANLRQYEQDIAAGDGEIWGKTKQIARDTGDVAGNILANPAVTGDVAAEGIGSLAGGAGLAGVFRNVGRKILAKAGEAGVRGRAVDIAAKAGRAASLPASVGIMEGGGAYAEVATEAMELLSERDDLTTEEKYALADQAARTAARIQAPVAAVLATLVAKFEMNPMARVGARKATGNMVRETVEETAQSATGTVSRNFALGEEVDVGRELTGGMGEEMAYGAVGGFTSAAPFAAPAIAISGTKKAAKAGFKAATAPLVERGRRIEAAARDVSFGKVGEAVSAAVGKSADVINSIKNTNLREAATKVADDIRNTNMDDIRSWTETAGNAAESIYDRMASAYNLKFRADASKRTVEGKFSVVEPNETVDPEDRAKVKEMGSVLTQIYEQEDVKKTVEEAEQMASEMIIDQEDVTPENPSAIQSVIAQADLAPDKSNPNNNNLLLEHAKNGKIELTPMQRATLLAANALQAQIAKDKKRPDSQTVSASVEQEASESVRNINTSMRTGNVDEAKARLEDMRMVAQLFRNKIEALNEHARQGTGNKSDAIGYDNLIGEPGKRKWIPAEVGMWVNKGVAKTVNFARDVERDAQAFTQLVNELSTIYPELGIEPLPEVALDFTSQAAKAAEPQAKAEPKAAKTEAPATPKREDKPVEAATKNTNSKSTTEAAETAQPKGGDTSTEANRKSKVGKSKISKERLKSLSDAALQRQLNRFQDGLDKQNEGERNPDNVATFIALDAEMTAREEAAVRNPKPEAKQEKAPETAKQEPKKTAEPKQSEAVEKPARAEPDNAARDDRGTDQATEAVEQEQSSVDPVVEEALDEKDEGPFASLLGSKPNGKLVSWFKNAFKIPETALTRTFGTGRPVSVIVDAIKSGETLRKFMGKDLRHEFTEELAENYQSYVEVEGKALGAIMSKNLNAFLKKIYGGVEQTLVEGKMPKSRKGDPVDLQMMVNGKALNITEIKDGKIVYNSELLGGAILAGLQWLLTTERHRTLTTDKMVEEMFPGVSPEAHDRLKRELDQGMSVTEAKRTMTRQIMRYWGVTPNNDTDMVMVQGIAESVAAEVLRAMLEQKLLGSSVVRATAKEDGLVMENGKAMKASARLFPMIGKTDAMKEWPTVIEEAVLLDPEVNYIGEPPKTVENTQMNNRRAVNTRDGKKALAHENNTPYRFDMAMLDAYMALGKENIAYLFGGGDLSNRKINQQTLATLEGRNRTMIGAFEQMQRLAAEATSRAKAISAATPQNKPMKLSDIPLYFAHNFSSIGRMQQLGLHSPQASKLMREVLLPTWSKLDLTDRTSGHYAFYKLALAQALGIKVETMPIEQAGQQALDMLEDSEQLASVIDDLRTFLKSGQKTLSNDVIINIREAMGPDNNTPVAFHAMMDYARFKEAEEAGTLNEFNTSLYVEADGVTNGPVNAMAMLTPGQFNAQWVQNMAKGGMFLSDMTMTMNDHRSKDGGDSKDLYTSMADRLSNHISQLFNDMHGDDNRAGMAQLHSLLTTFSALKPKEFQTGKVGEWIISRKITKNPLTITLYGSAEKGIAGNIVKDMVNELYLKLSDANEMMLDDRNLTLAEAMFGDVASETMTAEQHLTQFERRLNNLITKKTILKKGEITVVESGVKGIDIRSLNRETFKFNLAQIDMLRVNTRALFVRQMTQAIKDTVGEQVLDALENMRKATQVQGIFYEAAFKREFDKALAKKGKDEFLSQNEINEILDRLSYLAPKIATGDQLFDIAGSDQSDVTNKEFGRSYDDKFISSASINGPTNPGVSGIPTMVIGMGDGYMMQKLATMVNAIKGTLKVFDGMNMPLDQIEEGSRQANQAAFDSWMNNPMKHLHESFSQFLKDAPTDTWSEKQLEELGRSLLDFNEQRKGVTMAKIKAAMVRLEKDMKNQALSVEARHNVMRRTKIAVDQMASTGVTYQNEGTIDLTGLTNEQASVVLNKAYWEEFNKLRGEQTSEKTGGELAKFGELDEASGAVILDEASLKQAVKAMKIPAEQKSLIQAMFVSGKLSGYRVAVGVPWRLSQWAQGQSAHDVNFSEDTFGVTDPDNKIVYLVGREPSSETLAHELLHAATFDTVLAHYEGRDTTNKVETKRAVERIEALMQQFLEMGDEDAAPLNEVSENSRQSYADARAAIEQWLNRTDVSPAARKAGALNEFMAWSLSNQDLIRMQKRTKATLLGRIVADVIKGLKTLIWGRRDLAPKVWSDMHSNLRFNSEILLHTTPSVTSMLNTVLFHSAAAAGPAATPRQARLRNIKNIMDEKIVQFLDVVLEEQGEKDAQKNQALELAATAARSMWSGGFQMDPVEKEAFLAVVAVLATQAELDPNVMAEAQKLYAHTLSVMKPSHFMEDPSSTDQNDLAAAQEKYNAIIGLYDSGRRDTANRSTLLPAFLALSMVNEEFAQALAKMPMPAKKKLRDGKGFDQLLNNVGVAAMDGLSSLMARGDSKAPNVDAAVNALTHRLVAQAQVREASLLTQGLRALGATVTAANDGVVGAMGYVSNAGVNLAERGKRSDNRFVRGSAEALKFLSASVNEANAANARMGYMSAANKMAWMPKFMHEVMNEVIGRTDENAGVYDLIKRVRSWVQQTRQMFRDKLPKIIAGKFKTELTKQQWKHLFHGLGRTDIASLVALSNMTEAQVMELIADPSRRRAEINRLETALRQADSTKWPQWQTKATELAEFMVNGTKSNNTVRNAIGVANLWGETRPQTGYVGNETVVKDLDMLISLYALDKQPQAVRESLADLVQSDPEGMSFALSYLVGQRKGELEKESGLLSDLAMANHYKGHIPTENDPGVSLRIAPTESEAHMKSMGYIKVKDYEGSRADTGIGIAMSYYYSPVSGRAPYSQGIIQNIRPSYSGVDPLTGYTNNGMTGGTITDANDVVEASRRMRRGLNTGTEALLPIYDMQGNVVAFERGIDPEIEAKLEPKQHLAEAIGIWRGRQVEEAQAGEFNAKVMEQLRERWEQDRGLRRNEYVNVLDPKELRRDPVLRDSVRLLNRETRKMAERAFGKDKLWVRRDMLNDVLGYRAATIGDLWTGNTRIPKKTRDALRHTLTGVFGAEAYRKLVTAEKFAQNFVTDARVTIVVKSVIVPTANLMANFFQLLSRGVPLDAITKGMPAKTAEIDAFVKRRLRRIELEAELRATQDPARQKVLNKELRTIFDANRRMSIWPLVEAGEFASIADTGLTHDEIMLAEGRLSDYMEKLTSKLPPSLRTAGRYGIVSKDTALYQGLQRAVEYGDFLGKAILYDHLTKQKKLTHEQAMARITEEFVNYDRLSGRTRSYLENMGLMWFWNFKLRSIKIAMSIIRNNPVHALFAMSGPIATDLTAVGSPILDNGLAVGLDGRSQWSLGPNMAFNAHMLNPWFNLAT